MSDLAEEVAFDRLGIGTRVTALAAKHGGKKEFAKALGVSEGQLYRYLSDKQEMRITVGARIARLGGVSLDWLVFGGDLTVVKASEVDRSYTDEEVRLILDKAKTELAFASDDTEKNRIDYSELRQTLRKLSGPGCVSETYLPEVLTILSLAFGDSDAAKKRAQIDRKVLSDIKQASDLIERAQVVTGKHLDASQRESLKSVLFRSHASLDDVIRLVEAFA